MEYGDFHKFLVSLGVALVSLAFVIPWLFLKEPFDLMLEAKKFVDLTQNAQNILVTRQDLVKLILDILPIISIILILLGITSAIFGLLMWRGKQSVIDESERLELERKKKELEPMSTNETINKATNEIDEQVEIAVLETTKEKDIKESRVLRTNDALKRYFEIEELIGQKVKESCSASYDILMNYRISRAEFDIIMQAVNLEMHDIIFEIKYIRRLNLGFVIDTVNKVVLSNQIYTNTLERKVKSIILIVLGREFDDKYRNYKERAYEEISRLESNITLEFIPEDKINDLKPDFFIQIVNK